MTRQQRWKIKQERAGNCINCGLPRVVDGDESPFKRLCIKCGKVRRIRQRILQRNQPWKKGHVGRPPFIK